MNGNRAIWLVYRTDTNARGFWLVKRTLGWKNFMPEELSRNRFDVILQHDWSIEQCLLHIRVFFGGKTKSPCFDLFIHWPMKQITKTNQNHFSRSNENRSLLCGRFWVRFPGVTITLTSHLGQNVGLGEGWVGSFPETYNDPNSQGYPPGGEYYKM